MTPLHMAVKHSSVDIVKYLVDHGADVNIKSNMDMGGVSEQDYTPDSRLVLLLLSLSEIY